MTIPLRRRLAGAATLIGAPLVAAAVATLAPLAAAAGTAPPAPMVTVTDDTGAFGVDVPAEWVATTAPDHYPGIDGQFPYDTLLPTIVASPTGQQTAPDGMTMVPSLFVQAYPTVDAVDLGEFYGDYGVDCTTFDAGELAANGLSGRWGTTSGCPWAPGQVRASLWARFDDGSGSVFVDYFSTTGADATWEAIVDSIRRGSSPIQTTAGIPPVLPYGTFDDVPRLGPEPVRGTGCGADGSIGDVVPDGIWAGFVDVPAPGEALSLDLVCVYTPEAAPGVIADGRATILIPDGGTEPDPEYLVVNNNERERAVPASPSIELRDAVVDGDQCIEGPFLRDVEHADYQAWINIEGGEATWVVWGCDWFGDTGAPAPTPPSPQQATAPAATVAPVPGPNTEEALIQADCALLQGTVWEGDQFVGVEYPADGAPFSDSLRRAIETSRDFFGYEASQVQSQLARDAFAQYYAEWDSLLQAGIYTSTNVQAVTEAGWYALAPLQNACGWAG